MCPELLKSRSLSLLLHEPMLPLLVTICDWQNNCFKIFFIPWAHIATLTLLDTEKITLINGKAQQYSKPRNWVKIQCQLTQTLLELYNSPTYVLQWRPLSVPLAFSSHVSTIINRRTLIWYMCKVWKMYMNGLVEISGGIKRLEGGCDQEMRTCIRIMMTLKKHIYPTKTRLALCYVWVECPAWLEQSGCD